MLKDSQTAFSLLSTAVFKDYRMLLVHKAIDKSSSSNPNFVTRSYTFTVVERKDDDTVSASFYSYAFLNTQ